MPAARRRSQARTIDWAPERRRRAAARRRAEPSRPGGRRGRERRPLVAARGRDHPQGVIKALLGLAHGWDLTGKSPVRLDWTRAHRFRFDPATGTFTLDEPNIRLERDG